MNDFFSDRTARPAAWLAEDGPSGNIVVATRARLHRNLAGFHFPAQATVEERHNALDEIRTKVADQGSWSEGYDLSLTDLSDQQRKYLREAQLIRPQAALGSQPTAVEITASASQALVVNDQDHVQLVGLFPGFAPEKATAAVMALESELERKLCFAYQEDLGFLTAFAGSVGTGLHLAALIHLPGLVLAEEVDKILNALKQLRFSVRGLFGSGNTVRGSLFLVSSQVTLGRDEEEITNDFKYHLGKVVLHEKSARNQLHARDKLWLEDLIFRSDALLRSARLITAQESFDRLSHLRLGVGLGILPEFTPSFLNRMLIGQLTGHLQHATGEILKGSERSRARALFLRQALEAEKV